MNPHSSIQSVRKEKDKHKFHHNNKNPMNDPNNEEYS